MNVEKKFLQCIKDFNLISENDKILVAYSTGADSSALAFLLTKLKEYLKIGKIALAYLNHSIRKESDEEEIFAKQFAEKLGVEVFTKKVNIPYLSKKEKKSIEQKAREERYRFFTEILQEEGFNKIATGHHLSDLAETMVLWFIQGNKKGMIGFKPKEGSIIRPLYYLKKKEIFEYVKENRIPYREDITNKSVDYLRNKVRIEIIPELKKINNSLENSLMVLSNLAFVDEEFFSLQIEKFNFEEKTLNLSGIPDAIYYRVLDKWIYHQINCKISYNQIWQLIKNRKKRKYKLKICKNYYLIKENEIYILKIERKKEKVNYYYEIKAGDEVLVKEANTKIKSYITDIKNLSDIKNEKKIVCFDIGKIDKDTKFIIRNRKKGDRFKPFGSSEKKLKDVMIDLKIPADMRDSIPLVVFQDKILWVAGYKRSAYFPINEKSKNVICFEIKEV